LVAGGCHRAGNSVKFAGNGVDTGPFEITGPYTHENLSVFLLHSPNQDDREFITLDQGLKEGWVKVSEKQKQEVGELQIENQSEYPLFIKEGDRLQGESRIGSSSQAWWFLQRAARCRCRHSASSRADGKSQATVSHSPPRPMPPWRLSRLAKRPS